MAIRDKMRERCQPFLPAGENIRHVVYAQIGSPAFLFLSNFAVFFFKYRIIAFTERSIVIFRASRWSATPKEILAVLPRNIRIGPVSGRLWGRIELNGESIYVNRRFHKDIDEADAELGMMAGAPSHAASGQPLGGQPANWYPDPHGQARLRWWDGSRWTDQVAQ